MASEDFSNMSGAQNSGLPFRKMHGAGNDFIVVLGRDLKGLVLETETIAALCDRRTGVGADGLIIVAEPLSEDAHFRMIYFNADGGEAEMCGNGARCAVALAHQQGLCPGECVFDTYCGPLPGRVLGPELVEVGLPPFRDLQLHRGMEGTPWADQHSCNTGVPHLVIPVDAVAEVDLVRWGPHFRYHDHFAPAGANINWVSTAADGSGFHIRTYERGVEAETLACGTGASAAAVVLCALKSAASPVNLHTRGGDTLTVSVDLDKGQLRLQGPAVMSFRGEVEINGS
jgi:diaminopimelate epimerase